MTGAWSVTNKGNQTCAALADRHYSRRKVGSPQFMPPGQTLVLVTPEGDAVWGWWRPHPAAGIVPMNGLHGWTCTIFRNEGQHRSSSLVLDAERILAEQYPGDCGTDGMLTYVFDRKVSSGNPGYCYKMAGWTIRGRSADGRKTLLHKPFALAGVPLPPRGRS